MEKYGEMILSFSIPLNPFTSNVFLKNSRHAICHSSTVVTTKAFKVKKQCSYTLFCMFLWHNYYCFVSLDTFHSKQPIAEKQV